MTQKTGRIIKGVGGLYTVMFDGETVNITAKGAFRKEGITPLVGDIVECSFDDSAADFEKSGVISKILPRKNSLIRPASANIDRLFIVACSEHPKADIYMLDKLTAVAHKNGIETVFIFNKNDIASHDTLVDTYTRAGFKVFSVSAKDAEAHSAVFEAIREHMRGGVNFFAGASGVGKSSIIATLFPELDLETGALSKKISRGKHTTRASELFKVSDDTFIADTPGFSMLDAVTLRLIKPDELLPSFPDIEKYSHECRYTDCGHVKETAEECSVARAFSEGLISESRLASFALLKSELDKVNEWEL